MTADDPDWQKRQDRINAALGDALRALARSATSEPGRPQRAARRGLQRYLARAKVRGGKQ